MGALDLRTIARATGGVVQGRQVLAPGPGHSRADRSLSIRVSHESPTGFIVFSHAGDDFRDARDYVAAKLGLGSDAWRRTEVTKRKPGASNNPVGANQHASFEDNLYNVQDDLPKAPSGKPNDEINVDIVHVDTDAAARIARARAIWDEAGPATGSLASAYLASRGLDLETVYNVHGCLRFHPRCPWRDEEAQRTVYVPAMVAALRAIDGDEVTGIHRTRLTPEGAKLDRRMLGIAAGAAVKVDSDDAVTMGLAIGEGIETCLAARQLGFRPGWALGSAGAIAAFPVLGGIEALTILAESDDTNRRAVEACAARWHAAGREVIVIEPSAGSDLNDAMRGAA